MNDKLQDVKQPKDKKTIFWRENNQKSIDEFLRNLRVVPVNLTWDMVILYNSN